MGRCPIVMFLCLDEAKACFVCTPLPHSWNNKREFKMEKLTVVNKVAIRILSFVSCGLGAYLIYGFFFLPFIPKPKSDLLMWIIGLVGSIAGGVMIYIAKIGKYRRIFLEYEDLMISPEAIAFYGRCFVSGVGLGFLMIGLAILENRILLLIQTMI
jgi:hypothetical protein